MLVLVETHGGRAFVAGVAGGAVISVLFALARELSEAPIELEMALGSIAGLGPGRGTFAIGLVTHLLASGAIGMLYALGFERVAHRANVATGLAFAVPHTLIAGVVLG